MATGHDYKLRIESDGEDKVKVSLIHDEWGWCYVFPVDTTVGEVLRYATEQINKSIERHYRHG